MKLVLDAHPLGAQEKDRDGRLPLHEALAKQASEATVKLVLDAYPLGAQAKDNEGRLPADRGKGEMRVLLLLAADRRQEALAEGWDMIRNGLSLACRVMGHQWMAERAIALASHGMAVAKRTAETDESKGEEVQMLSQRVQQAACALFEVTLSEDEERQLYHSPQGAQLLDAAVEAHCLLFLARPRKQRMLLQWWWPLPWAEQTWCARATTVGILTLALPLNLLALPLFTLVPPLENVALRERARRRDAASDAVPVEWVDLVGNKDGIWTGFS